MCKTCNRIIDADSIYCSYCGTESPVNQVYESIEEIEAELDEKVERLSVSQQNINVQLIANCYQALLAYKNCQIRDLNDAIDDMDKENRRT